MKAELDNIFRSQAEQSPFLRTLSLGNQASNWSNLPAPSVDFGQDGEGAYSNAVPFVPFGNVGMDDNSLPDKHVAFGDENKDDKGKLALYSSMVTVVEFCIGADEIQYSYIYPNKHPQRIF